VILLFFEVLDQKLDDHIMLRVIAFFLRFRLFGLRLLVINIDDIFVDSVF